MPGYFQILHALGSYGPDTKNGSYFWPLTDGRTDTWRLFLYPPNPLPPALAAGDDNKLRRFLLLTKIQPLNLWCLNLTKILPLTLWCNKSYQDSKSDQDSTTYSLVWWIWAKFKHLLSGLMNLTTILPLTSWCNKSYQDSKSYQDFTTYSLWWIWPKI